MAYQKQASDDRLKEITDQLEKGLQDLFSSEKYTDYLKTMSKFYSYSASNTLLIYMQRPDASHVAGYNDWKNNYHRHVKRDEHGMKILAPCPYKQRVEREKTGPDGKPVTEIEEIQRAAFKPVTVFDVSQTEGEPLPTLGMNELTGDVEHYPDFFEALKQVAPFPVGFEAITTGAKGYCNYAEQRIAINEGMAEVQNVKTAIHEITHATLHNYYAEKEKGIPPEQRKDQRTREVEAESVAYTVCQHYGIDTADYSFGYIAGWSSDKQTKELKASLGTIRNTAAGLITSIDEKFQEITKDREQAAPVVEAPEPTTPGQTEPDSFTIYQLKDGDDLHYHRFEPLERLQAAGLSVEAGNYDRIYTAPLFEGDTLEGIYTRFNIDHPEDFTGHSLSVSDVVILHQGGSDRAYYVDSFGFSEVPQFLEQQRAGLTAEAPEPQAPENPLAAAEMGSEQNYNMIDGQVNNLPPELDPAIQPVVTILWSESDKLHDGQQMPLAEADRLFGELDAAHGPGYDKTSFSIAYTLQGELSTYEGRQDFGDGDGGLTQHIRAYHEYYAHDESWKNHVLHTDGPEAWEKDVAEREMILTVFVPYMQLHCNLADMEKKADEVLALLADTPEPDGVDRTNSAYYTALKAYVAECRHELNTATGEYHLPDCPKKEDFTDPELAAYQEQVREEVKQEAADAGMTVEEYAANGYEPLSSSQPVKEPDGPIDGTTGEQLSFSNLTEAAKNPEPTKEPTATPTYYAINESAARHAKEAISFSDYRQGSATAEYRHMVDEAVKIAERQKSRVDPMHHEKIDRLLDTYCRKLAANMNHHNEILGRVPSVMIAGPSNFPVRKKEKQNAAMDSNMQEWRDIQGLLDKIRSTGMGGISADDPEAVSKLQTKLASLEESQETMKAVNAYYRKHKTLDGCPHLSPQTIEKLKADMAQGWHLEGKPFASWALSNNNAEIHRVKARIESLTRKADTPFTGWGFDGGKVEINKEENRLQIFFDEKPDADTRAELKGQGFRWAPSTEAWQRQLTDNAFRAADYLECIKPVTGEKPTELQRKARTEKPSIRQQLEAAKSAPEQPHKKKSPAKDGPERS